jgi:hypothetical protein
LPGAAALGKLDRGPSRINRKIISTKVRKEKESNKKKRERTHPACSGTFFG